jgi:hypothetical protein
MQPSPTFSSVLTAKKPVAAALSLENYGEEDEVKAVEVEQTKVLDPAASPPPTAYNYAKDPVVYTRAQILKLYHSKQAQGLPVGYLGHDMRDEGDHHAHDGADHKVGSVASTLSARLIRSA